MNIYDIPIEEPASWIEKGVPQELKAQTHRFESIEHLFANGGYWRQRDAWISRYSFAIPTAEIIARLAQFKLLELVAGTGWWAALIKAAGGDIIATDKASPLTGSNYPQKIGSYVDLEQIDATSAVAKYPDRDLLIIWPCLNKRWSLNAIRALSPGRTVIHIGEPGGCTATGAFYEYLANNFDEAETHWLPNWNGIHDHLYIHQNKAQGAE